jgi:hypothetical protein
VRSTRSKARTKPATRPAVGKREIKAAVTIQAP